MRVSILAYDGCLGAEVFGLADILLIANRVSRIARPTEPLPFEVSVIGVRGGAIDLAGGARLSVRRPPVRTDLLVVPAFDMADIDDLDGIMNTLAPEIRFIARAAARHPVAAICGGSFLLGEAGLLDGRRATTAWAFATELARRYPAARVEAQALLVRDGDVLTSGAFSAGGDLALQIVREHAGAGLARAVGHLGLIDGGRSSQSPYLDARLLSRSREPFSRGVTRWLELRLTEPYKLKRLAEAFDVSSRTLLRRFKAETGRTPLEQLQMLRIARAKQLLESTGLGLSEIAEQVGYMDLPTFVRLFARQVALTPAAYRRQFRPAA
jgi:transcriptional regulator GlxA family with amidase domain